MSDAPEAEHGGPLSPEARAALRHCDQLYARWLQARATYDDPARDDSDATSDKLADEVDDAARRLLSAPSVVSWMILRKWEVLDLWVAEDADGGQSLDNRVIFALGCIKADLIRFGGPS